MNKKVLAIIIVVIMLFSTSACALKLCKNNKNSIEKDDKKNELDSSYIDYNGEEIRVFDINSNNDTNFDTGWIKIDSKGKGLFLMVPLKIMNINVPIPNVQFPNFFPVRFQFFLTLCVYNDSNAQTTLTYRDGRTVYLNGSHSLCFGMFKIQTMKFLEVLFDSGLYDGFQQLQQGNTAKGDVQKGPIAKIVYDFLNQTFDAYPFIDIPDEMVKFLEYLKGQPAQYRPNFRIFDTPLANNLRELVELFYEKIVNKSVIIKTLLSLLISAPTAPAAFAMIRLFTVLFPSAMFWNRMPIRTSLLGFKIPLEVSGATPFIYWSNSSKLNPLVSKVQDGLPDIFYEYN